MLGLFYKHFKSSVTGILSLFNLTYVLGEMVKETGQINKSLFTLGKVIASLDKGEAFVPYRDSKLTKLLMDSLGGSSTCIMVACCSPSQRYIEETLSTLSYASRALNITNTPVVQLEPTQQLISALRSDNHQLRAENAQLRLQLGLSLTDTVRPSSAALHHAAAMTYGGNTAASRGGAREALGERGGGGRGEADEGGSVRGSRVLGSGGSSRSGSPMRKSASLKSAQLYDKAVGYAEGYSAGLDQAKQVLSSGGLDLGAHDLHSYDLSGLALPTPPQAAHIGAVLPPSRGGSARLPPLPPSVDVGSQQQQQQQQQQQIMASLAHMSMEELRHQVLRLHGAHAASHRTCAGLREECLRLQTLLDHQALASAPTTSFSSRHAAASPSRHASAHSRIDQSPAERGGRGGGR